MNKSRTEQTQPLEPFSDRLETLFGELELATRWERPSILFAVYSSDYVRAEAQTALERQLAAANQTTCRVVGDVDPETGLIQHMKSAIGDCRPVIFVDGLGSAQDECGRALLTNLNAQRDAFIENGLRVVFWLNESQVCDLAHCAPDLWSFRHRVVEFLDAPEPDKIIARTLDAAWQSPETPPGVDRMPVGFNIPEALLNRLPQGEQSAGIYTNLLLTLGILHWRNHDSVRADEFIRAATEIADVTGDNRLLAECLNAAALIRIGEENYEQAVQLYQRSLSEAPEQTFPWGQLGQLYSRLGRDHEAVTAFRKALQTEPADATSWLGIAEVYGRLQLAKPAIEHYQKAVEFSPNLAAAWMGLARVYADSGAAEQAEMALHRSLEIDDKNGQAWLELGRLEAAKRKIAQAIAAYRKALELDPKNVHALRALGELLLGAGMNEDAITAFRGAIALDPNSGVDYRNLGMAHFQNGDLNEAVLLFRKSLELPTVPALRAETLNRLGDAYRGLQEYDKAVQAYQAADHILRSLPGATQQSEKGESAGLEPLAVAAPVVTPAAPTHTSVTAAETGPDILSFERAALGVESQSWLEHGLGLEDPTSGIVIAPVISADTLPPAASAPEPEPMPDLSLEAPALWLGERPVVEYALPEGAMSADGDGDPFDNAVAPAASGDPGVETEEAAYWNNLGNEFMDQGAYSDAISAYTYAIELSPQTNWPYIRNLTTAHYRKGKSRGEHPVMAQEEAVNVSDASAAMVEPTDGGESQLVAEAKSSPAEPIASPQPIQASNGNGSVHRLIQLGNEQMRAGDYAGAAATFVQAIEKQPDLGWSYCNLGIAYSHLGKDTYAVLALKKGIDYLQGDKEKAIAWRHLSDVYAKVGDPANASHALETASSLEREKSSILQRARVMLLGNTAQ
jgi:tetratricopeptide (TPR) repeat protein